MTSSIQNLSHQFSFIVVAVHFRLVLVLWSVLAKRSPSRFGELLWGDYAPSIGHAHKPLHLMYTERLEESDGEKGG